MTKTKMKEAENMPSTTDKLSVEKLQEQLNTAKKALTEAIGDIEQLNGSDDTIKYYKQALAALEGGEDDNRGNSTKLPNKVVKDYIQRN